MILTALLTAGLFVGCSDDDDNGGDGSGNTVVQTIQDDSDLDSLAAKLEMTGLIDSLNADSSYTIFAPTNDVFASLPDSILQDTALMTNVLLYHVADSTLTTSQLDSSTATLNSLLGPTITVNSDTTTGSITVNGSTQVSETIEASNGVIYKINEILVPQS